MRAGEVRLWFDHGIDPAPRPHLEEAMTVLVIQHEALVPPGLLTRTPLDLCVARPDRGEALPARREEVDALDALVVLGGTMSANDDAEYPWLPATRRLIAQAADAEVPTLLLCLGHQLGAVALGGTVARNPRGPLWGVEPVGLTDAGREDELLRHLPPDAPVVHWNGDVVTGVPHGATVLARDRRGDVQAARYAPRVWGLQCHPEADAEIVSGWGASETAPEDRERAARAVEAVRVAEHDLAEAWMPVLDAFAALAEAPRR